MRKDNPACFECPKDRRGIGIHHWVVSSNGLAKCVACGLKLNKRDSEDLLRE